MPDVDPNEVRFVGVKKIMDSVGKMSDEGKLSEVKSGVANYIVIFQRKINKIPVIGPGEQIRVYLSSNGEVIGHSKIWREPRRDPSARRKGWHLSLRHADPAARLSGIPPGWGAKFPRAAWKRGRKRRWPRFSSLLLPRSLAQPGSPVSGRLAPSPVDRCGSPADAPGYRRFRSTSRAMLRSIPYFQIMSAWIVSRQSEQLLSRILAPPARASWSACTVSGSGRPKPSLIIAVSSGGSQSFVERSCAS
jgi:hypothetical protein